MIYSLNIKTEFDTDCSETNTLQEEIEKAVNQVLKKHEITVNTFENEINMVPYHNEGKCPYCNSELNYEDFELVDEFVSYEYYCPKCDKNFVEWYKLVYDEIVEKD